MTEMEFIHPTEVISDAISSVLILCTALLQKMSARVTRDGKNCAKNSTFNGYDIYFDEANPISAKGIQLLSLPRFIYMAPGRV